MLSNSQIFLMCALIAGLAHSAQSFSCYICDSAYHSNCGETFNKEGVQSTDCSRTAPPRFLATILGFNANATGCMKHVTSVNGRPHIVRSCFFGDIRDTRTGCSQDPTNIIHSRQLSCDVCQGELCNGAPAMASFGVFVFVAAILTKILM